MSNRTLYVVEDIPLDKARSKGVDSELGPKEIRCEFTYICVLTLTGEAQLSFSITGRSAYFGLVQGMRVYMPEGTKSIFVTNEAQEGKKLTLYLGYKDKSEVIR